MNGKIISKILGIRIWIYTRYIKRKLASVGNDFRVHSHFWINHGENIYVGDNVTVQNFNSFIATGKIIIGNNVSIRNFCEFNGDIEIGNNVSFSSQCYVTSRDHNRKDHELRDDKEGKVKIGNNVQIFNGVKILKGVIIKDNVLVRAGAVVDKDIPSNSIVYGNPMIILKAK